MGKRATACWHVSVTRACRQWATSVPDRADRPIGVDDDLVDAHRADLHGTKLLRAVSVLQHMRSCARHHRGGCSGSPHYSQLLVVPTPMPLVFCVGVVHMAQRVAQAAGPSGEWLPVLLCYVWRV